jgi:hypothetical protein
MARPLPFRNVILSFRISAAKIKAKIGLVEISIEEFMGDVRFNPIRKKI